MSGAWEMVFKNKIDDRDVEGEIYSEGGYRVSTKQKNDYAGHVSNDGRNTIIISSSPAGVTIEIHGETLEELKKALVEDGEFSSDEADKIIGNFST